jgi:hypothetical protein
MMFAQYVGPERNRPLVPLLHLSYTLSSVLCRLAMVLEIEPLTETILHALADEREVLSLVRETVM